jgi:hypothetical protein
MYLSAAAIVVIVAVGLPLYFKLYKPPTCFDGLKNGSEQGVDCGGSCEKLCQSSFLPPSVSWTRFEQVAPGLYNVAAYIINPNKEAEARNVPYHLVLYDKAGIPILDKKGTVTLPPHRNTLAFMGSLNVAQSIPIKAAFEFLELPDWNKKADPLGSVRITDQNYTEDDVGSSLQVSLQNTSVYPIPGVHVYAILYDDSKNAIGFSKTVLDDIPAGQTVIAPFTWPLKHGGKVISEEVLPVIE